MTEIRSYRRVFDLERRVYSVDGLRLNPGGVPVRGIVYFVVLLLLALMAGTLPLVGALPWYARDLVLPAAAATALSVVRLEGRTFHLAATALARHLAAPRRLGGLSGRSDAGGTWYPDDILVLPDGSDPRLRRLRYTGPGAVRVAVEHERLHRADMAAAGIGRAGRRHTLVLRQLPARRPARRGQVILLARGARMLIRPHSVRPHSIRAHGDRPASP